MERIYVCVRSITLTFGDDTEVQIVLSRIVCYNVCEKLCFPNLIRSLHVRRANIEAAMENECVSGFVIALSLKYQ